MKEKFTRNKYLSHFYNLWWDTETRLEENYTFSKFNNVSNNNSEQFPSNIHFFMLWDNIHNYLKSFKYNNWTFYSK